MKMQARTMKTADVPILKTDPVTVFHYEKPDVSAKKVSLRCGRTTRGDMAVQTLSLGGENILHSHVSNDGFWFVLKGGVRFYTTDDELVAELGENEGFVTPHRYKYWFESVPEKGDLELIRFGAVTKPFDKLHGDRIAHAPEKPKDADLLTKDEVAALHLAPASS